MEWIFEDGLHSKEMENGIRLEVELNEISQDYTWCVFDGKKRGLDGWLASGKATTVRGGRAAASRAYNKLFP